jgi:hypothetical protein
LSIASKTIILLSTLGKVVYCSSLTVGFCSVVSRFWWRVPAWKTAVILRDQVGIVHSCMKHCSEYDVHSEHWPAVVVFVGPKKWKKKHFECERVQYLSLHQPEWVTQKSERERERERKKKSEVLILPRFERTIWFPSENVRAFVSVFWCLCWIFVSLSLVDVGSVRVRVQGVRRPLVTIDLKWSKTTRWI